MIELSFLILMLGAAVALLGFSQEFGTGARVAALIAAVLGVVVAVLALIRVAA